MYVINLLIMSSNKQNVDNNTRNIIYELYFGNTTPVATFGTINQMMFALFQKNNNQYDFKLGS